jgi:hypothetical protein
LTQLLLNISIRIFFTCFSTSSISFSMFWSHMLQLARAQRQAGKDTTCWLKVKLWTISSCMSAHSNNSLCTPALSPTVESAGSWGRTQLLTNCWNNYRDVCAMFLGDVDNYQPTKNCMCVLGLT